MIGWLRRLRHRRCEPLWGIADASDPRFCGGYVDIRGVRHDPYRHRPMMRRSG